MLALARLAVRRPVAVAVVAVTLSVLGWTAWRNLPIDLLPDLQSPTVVVSIRSGDRPPAEMERVYGEQVEQRLFTVNGIREIDQVARTGRLIATVTFNWEADMDFALVEVEKSIGPLRSDLDVDEVLVRRFDPRQLPIVTIGLLADETNGPSLAELRRIAERQVAIALERLDGIGEVRVTGGREIEVRVELDPYKLEAHRLALRDVEARLQAANLDVNAGTLEEQGKVYLVRGLARFRSPEDVANVVLRYTQDERGRSVPVHVRDVATVRLDDKEISHLVRVDGREGVGLEVYKEAGANTVAVSRTVKGALEGVSGELPGVELRLITDEAALVEDAISDVQDAALWGVGLAILVLVLFLRSAGSTLIVAFAVPVSLLTSLFLMHFADRSLNLMTLGGLALGAGMLVDNAIVVVESIYRRLGQGMEADEAAAHGTADVGGAIVASTLTTCAVFLPVIFVQGLSARLVSGLAFTVITSLLASLFVALLLIPALARWLLPRRKVVAVDPGSGRLERFVHGLLGAPWAVVGVAVVVGALALFGLASLGTELLPPADPRQFSVRLVGPPGQQVEATAEVSATVESILEAAAGERIAAMLSEVGRIPDDERVIRAEQTEENTSRIRVRLEDGGQSGTAIVASASPAVEALGQVEAIWEVGGSTLSRAIGSTGPPVVIEIAGQALSDLRFGADQVVAAIDGLPSLWNVRSSFEGGPPELRLVLDRTIADGVGVDLDTVAASVQASLDGRVATRLSLGDEERDVVLALPAVARDRLLDIPIRAQSGARMVVGDVARLSPEAGAREIFRRDQRRVARVTARIAPGFDYPDALGEVREALAEMGPLPGLTTRLAGEESERSRTFRDLGFAGALALLLVFMVLAGSFESLLHPLTVGSSVGLAAIGVAALLVPLGRPLGVMEAIGMIVLAGVAVNDAILLVAAARNLIAEGLEVRVALARAAGIRLRPILMTTATTVLALLPLALGQGDAAELRRPMALTIIGGIVFSTLGSLLVVPCVYRIFHAIGSIGRRR